MFSGRLHQGEGCGSSVGLKNKTGAVLGGHVRGNGIATAEVCVCVCVTENSSQGPRVALRPPDGLLSASLMGGCLCGGGFLRRCSQENVNGRICVY